MSNYYNTTALSNPELHNQKLKTKSQEDAILELYEVSPDKWLTPHQIEQLMLTQGIMIDIISVRRAITDLTKEGKLVKSGKAGFAGGRGVNTHAWKFNNGKLF